MYEFNFKAQSHGGPRTEVEHSEEERKIESKNNKWKERKRRRRIFFKHPFSNSE